MKILIAVVCLVILCLITLMVMSGHTAVTLPANAKTIGVSTPVTVELANPHGVRRVSAYVEQGGARTTLYEETAPSHRLLWSRHEPVRRVTFEAGKNKAPNLKEGKARLVVEAVSNDLRGSTDTAATDVDVILAP